jgi:hypothetical protein
MDKIPTIKKGSGLLRSLIGRCASRQSAEKAGLGTKLFRHGQFWGNVTKPKLHTIRQLREHIGVNGAVNLSAGNQITRACLEIA